VPWFGGAAGRRAERRHVLLKELFAAVGDAERAARLRAELARLDAAEAEA
jgi:hypothetical protein